MRPLMVLGCSSNAGKSLLVTGLARWFSRQGIDVAPFKAQNMSNNARVVDGGEIGVAQWLQALAAGVTPTTEMNPVLLKPEADTRSQVIVSGIVRRDVTETSWMERGPLLWPAMSEAFDHLAATHDLVILEGAGSPAEINLPDQVNNRMLAHSNATALLVADVDRGGSFAHLFGTWSLVPEATRARLSGFVLNKFRGDPSLLDPAPSMLKAMTGMQLAGVMPMLDHDLPDEEGASLRSSAPARGPIVGIVRYPFASNLDEFHLLEHVAQIRWIQSPGDLIGCTVVILPGSKHVAADLDWVRRQGLEDALRIADGSGRRIIGICGGAMMLGTKIIDDHRTEGSCTGLGLLELRTVMDPLKLTRRTALAVTVLDPPWSVLNGLQVEGYEIRHGRIESEATAIDQLLWSRGSVLATTVHGLFEDPSILQRLFGRRPPDVLEETFDALADAVEEHLDGHLLTRSVLGREARSALNVATPRRGTS